MFLVKLFIGLIASILHQIHGVFWIYAQDSGVTQT